MSEVVAEKDVVSAQTRLCPQMRYAIVTSSSSLIALMCSSSDLCTAVWSTTELRGPKRRIKKLNGVFVHACTCLSFLRTRLSWDRRWRSSLWLLGLSLNQVEKTVTQKTWSCSPKHRFLKNKLVPKNQLLIVMERDLKTNFLQNQAENFMNDWRCRAKFAVWADGKACWLKQAGFTESGGSQSSGNWCGFYWILIGTNWRMFSLWFAPSVDKSLSECQQLNSETSWTAD